ncbi:MAG TPA: hypothetical protein VJK02_25625 [Anaerolineales bacterium]|nr:hypothetical protein [Anaerolineales bacterium]
MSRIDDPSQARELAHKGRGVRLSARYARILAVFVIWAGSGVAILMFAVHQWFFGGLLGLICLVTAGIAVDGRLLKERVHTSFDLFSQWLAMVLPVISISALLIALGRTLLISILPYILVYLLGNVVLVVLAFVEIRKAIKA